jgi:hypothetical protein
MVIALAVVTLDVAPARGECVGLVMNWRADGNTLDGNGVPAQIVGRVGSEPGIAGQGWSFSGDGEVRVPRRSSLDLTGDLSISMWVFARSTAGLIGLLDKEVGGAGYNLHINDGRLHVRMATATMDVGQIPSGTTWTHVVVTRRGTVTTAFINGQQVGTMQSPPSLGVAAKDLYIGSWFDERRFRGILDEVAIFSRAIEYAEMRQLFERGVARQSACDAPPAPYTFYEQGYWDGGAQGNARLAFRANGDELIGATDSASGETTVVLRLEADGVLRGTWSELPTRAPPHAGRVEFRPRGATLDGRYDRGPGTAWSEDWDVTHINAAPSPALRLALTRVLMQRSRQAMPAAPRTAYPVTSAYPAAPAYRAPAYPAPPLIAAPPPAPVRAATGAYPVPPLIAAPAPVAASAPVPAPPQQASAACIDGCVSDAGIGHCEDGLRRCQARAARTQDASRLNGICTQLHASCRQESGATEASLEACAGGCMEAGR